MFPRPGTAWLAQAPQHLPDRPSPPRRTAAKQTVTHPPQPAMLVRLATVIAAGALLVAVVMSASA